MTTTEEEYLAVIFSKTAALFAAASEIGGVIAGRSEAEQSALRAYGTNIGLAFQLIDDALDYSGEAAMLGKSVGDDFREGKITLPVVLSHRRGTVEERAFWRRTLQDGDIEEGDLHLAIALMRRHNAIEETIERARIYGREAQKALDIFPASEAKAAMLDAVDFSISRAY
jgi:octaprenyl-diphosphate synthase